MNLNQVDEILCTIQGKLFSFSHITIQNYESEYSKFVESHFTYNPQFTYKPFQVQKYISQLESVHITDTSVWGEIFEDFRQYLLTYAKIIQNIGTNHFDTKSFFGSLSPKLIAKAQNELVGVYKISQKKTTETYSAQQLVQRIQEEMLHIGANDWSIQFRKNASSNVSVNASKKCISIKEGTSFSEKRVQKLLVHEIQTHVKRAINGSKQKYRIFSVGVPKYLATEEGLARYNEVEAGVTSPYFTKLQALHVLATNYASQYGFVELFAFVQQYISDVKRAFKLCARIKRGLGDTSKPGGFLKDHIYFQGELEVRDYLQNGGNIHDLYIGKVSVWFLQKYKERLDSEIVWK